MRAVIFDLFGTLTDPTAEISRRAVVEDTAVALGVQPAEFWTCWSRSFPQRITGAYGGTAQTLRRLVDECGAQVQDDVLALALREHLAAMEALRSPRAGALAVLDELRDRGFPLAVMTDCSSEVVEGWDGSPYAARFHAAVMSWREGWRKPDPRLYATAAARLGVRASQCWYVGDGGGREHAGALAAGMTPVLVTNADVPAAAVLRADADDYLPEHRVHDLDELLALVGQPQSR